VGKAARDVILASNLHLRGCW